MSQCNPPQQLSPHEEGHPDDTPPPAWRWHFRHAPRAIQSYALNRITELVRPNAEKQEWQHPAEYPERQQPVILGAPVGTGKSAIGASLVFSHRGLILTSQKTLQDQYLADWPALPVLKGRNNYDCEESDERVLQRASSAMLEEMGGPAGRACRYTCEDGALTCPAKGGQFPRCPFSLARNRVIFDSRGVINYALFLIDDGMSGAASGYTVMDEAHKLSDAVLSAASPVFTGNLKLGSQSVPQAEWLRHYLEKAKLNLRDLANPIKFERLRSAIGPFRDAVALELSKLEEHIESVKQLRQKPQSHVLAAHRACTTLSAALASMMSGEGADEVEWIAIVTRAKERNPHSPDSFLKEDSICLRPIQVEHLVAQHIPPSTVMMTGTPDYYLIDHLGLRKRMVNLASPFPIENRRVIVERAAWLSFNRMDQEFPKAMARLIDIIGQHQHEKGIIHAPSFAMADKIYQGLPLYMRERVKFHSRSDDQLREQMIAAHLADPKPSILLSPSMMEGLDLKDDQGRFNVIFKVPYASIKDPWVAIRKDRFNRWYEAQSIRNIIQAAGRTTRSETDWSVTYILDANFSRLLGSEYLNLYPKWFLQALRDG